jgi:hypothetical protein
MILRHRLLRCLCAAVLPIPFLQIATGSSTYHPDQVNFRQRNINRLKGPGILFFQPDCKGRLGDFGKKKAGSVSRY